MVCAVESSAKRSSSQEELSFISFTFIEKQGGPERDPWGTPKLTLSSFEQTPFKTVNLARFFR